MSSLSHVALPKPKDWQDFERKTRELFACVLADPNTQMHGRNGQSQHGVDIWGYRSQDHGRLVGIQCKKSDDPVTDAELDAELEKAKAFVPSIAEFIRVTTAPRDEGIQRKARQLTDSLAHTERQIFVAVWGWQDIEEHAAKYAEAHHAFDPTFNPYAERARQEILAKLDQITRDTGVPIAPLRAVLAKLGEIAVTDQEIPKRFELAIEQLIELRRQLARSTVDRPEFVATRQQVLGLIDRGDLVGARAILQRALGDARGLRLAREQAEVIANEGLIDQIELRFHDAANRYAEAANIVATFDPEGVWGLLMHQAGALSLQGKDFAENEAVVDAIAVYKRCLTLAPRPKRPLDWASSQNSLGVALSTLGERENSTERLQEAVEAFREALKECTRARAPIDWAQTNNNLGNALTNLGGRDGSMELLEAARAAYGDALLECTRERVPLEWANIQSNLGTTYQIIGKLDGETKQLELSLECYRAALLERTRDRTPLDWAQTQNNLGNTLFLLGVRERSIKRLQEAIAAHLDALKERTRDRVPLDWAQTVSNVSRTLLTFAIAENNRWRIAAAIDGFRKALEIFEQYRPNRYIAQTRMMLAEAEQMFAEREPR